MNPLEDDGSLSRRGFLVGSAGAAAAVGASGTALAQDEENASDEGGDGNESAGGDGNESAGGNESADGGGGGGGTQEITVGPDASPEFDPDSVSIPPGTEVVWTWDSDNHNVNPGSQPDEAEWEGHQPTEDAGFEYSHTFEVEGEYSYVCDPHVGQGMEGSITVDSEATLGGGGGGAAEVGVHDLGVPIQAHYVGIATILSIFVSIVFAFYLLKYGESAHTSSPGRR